MAQRIFPWERKWEETTHRPPFSKHEYLLNSSGVQVSVVKPKPKQLCTD